MNHQDLRYYFIIYLLCIVCIISCNNQKGNKKLVSDPAKINTDAHTEWMIVIEANDASAQFAALLDSDAYENFVKSI